MAKRKTTTKTETEKVEILRAVQGRAETIGDIIELPTNEVERLVHFGRVKRVGVKKVETR